jgi:hypothetical protein
MKNLLISFLFVSSAIAQTGYEPFLIAPFHTGKSIGMAPWQSPVDAFPTLQNARVNKGVLEKRLGHQLFATMNHGGLAQSTTTITGIHVYVKSGLPQLLIFDTLRVNRYNPVDQTMDDITGDSDIFSGGSDDFFHFVNWLGTGYFTNNVDQIYKYTGSGDVAVFNAKIDSATEDNHIDTCRFIFIKNDRMLLLDTVEHGDWFPNRLRYSPVLSTDFSASGGGYVDAPTQERIVSAGWVGKDIVVFFQGLYAGSLWKIRTTGDTDLPLRWEKVATTDTSLAPYSLVEFNEGVSVIGLNNIIFYDGFKIQYLDLGKVRDVVDDFDTSKIRLSTAYNAIQEQHIYYTYTASGSSNPDRILDYNVIDRAWSVYTVDVQCFGTFDDQAVPIWTETDDIYVADAATMSQMTLDSREILNNPFPFTLMGDRTSKVYKFGVGNYDGVDDATGTIALDVRSSRWNPFIREGKQAYLKNAVFLVDNDSTASFSVAFYRNSRSTADRTNTVSCYDSTDTGADKIWVSTSAGGTVGNFHRIKISHDERNNRPRIHAIMLFMRRGGEIKF